MNSIHNKDQSNCVLDIKFLILINNNLNIYQLIDLLNLLIIKPTQIRK